MKLSKKTGNYQKVCNKPHCKKELKRPSASAKAKIKAKRLLPENKLKTKIKREKRNATLKIIYEMYYSSSTTENLQEFKKRMLKELIPRQNNTLIIPLTLLLVSLTQKYGMPL